MSDETGPERHDPLAALRAADHRTFPEVWRERLRDWFQQRLAFDPATSRWRPLLFVVVCLGLAAAGWQSYVATEPPVENSLPLATANSDEVPLGDAPVTAEQPAAATTSVVSQEVVVHVAGAVNQPGLVTGAAGWRVNDAVVAAGGATSAADLDRLNLAALIVDGERLYVPAEGEDVPPGTVSDQNRADDDGVVDVNVADETQLQALPGVGPVTASAIVAHRTEHGLFADVDALVAVGGIGPATVEQLRDHVRVG